MGSQSVAGSLGSWLNGVRVRKTGLAGQVQFLLHRAAPVSTTTPESISPTATQSNLVVFAPVTGSARPNWVGSTEGTKSVGVGVGVWLGSSAPRIGRTGSTSQVMVPVLEAKPPPDALVTEACTLSFPSAVPLYVKVALPLASVVAVPVTPALGPLRILKSTPTLGSGDPPASSTVDVTVAVPPTPWVWVAGVSAIEPPSVPTPAPPIERHCSDSFGLQLAESKPPVSST